MSVRIYEISKELEMENKEVMKILRERGFEVKSASSTIDNISAEAFISEFQDSGPNGGGSEAATETAEPEPAPPEDKKPAGGPSIPMVRSAADIEREKQEKAEQEKREREKRLSEGREKQAEKMGPPKPAQPPQPAPRPAPAAKSPAPPPRRAPAPPPRAPQPISKVSPRPPSAGQAPQVNVPGLRSREPEEPAQPAAKSPAPAPQPKQPQPRPAQAGPPPQKAPAPAPSVPAAKSPAPAPAKAPNIPPRPAPKTPGAAPAIPSREETKKGAPAAPAAEKATDQGKVVEQDGVKVVQVKPPIVVRDYAGLIGLKPFQLISELMDLGIFASMNQTIDEETAGKLAERHGFLLEVKHRGEDKPQAKKKIEEDLDDPKNLVERGPVVCVLGHVDHGKTSLLDAIRQTKVTAGEAGGITQHIGAYQVEHNGHKITFIDTPGHAAFSKMRERGASVTDIAVLVVAADDGFKPQTEQALEFAQKANVPVVVAINKMDAPGANENKVKQEMQRRGIASEDWGGEVQTANTIAVKREGIDDLLESILLQAEIMELKANPKVLAEGTIVESQIEQGRGPVATVIVERGTLKPGDALICGAAWCKVRALIDDTGKKLKSVTPGSPAKVMGWSEAPKSGHKFQARKNDKEVKREAEEISQQLKKEKAEKRAAGSAQEGAMPTNVEDFLAMIDQTKQTSLKVVIRADVVGSAEALAEALEEIKSDKVRLEILDVDVGVITKNDVELCSTSGALIVGFNTKLDNGVQQLAKHNDVRIIQHTIIYELIDQVKDAMADLLEPEKREVKMGAAEVRAVFPLGKGFVAGCMVTEGQLKRDARARLFRGDEQVYEGRIGMLKRFKEDATEVRAGYECGCLLDKHNDYQEGDVIECFSVESFRPSL